VSERLTALLESRLRSRDRLQAERMDRFTHLSLRLAENEEGNRLLAMLLDDFYQETFHAPLVPAEDSYVPSRAGGTTKPQRKRRPIRSRDKKRSSPRN
jgi:ATP-dependent RNA helicase DeaD